MPAGLFHNQPRSIGDVNIGVKGGTLGIGLEDGVDLSDNFALQHGGSR